jgi:hypothetical protein
MPRFIDDMGSKAKNLPLPKPRTIPKQQSPMSPVQKTSVGRDVGAGMAALLPKNLRKRKTQGLDYE